MSQRWPKLAGSRTKNEFKSDRVSHWAIEESSSTLTLHLEKILFRHMPKARPRTPPAQNFYLKSAIVPLKKYISLQLSFRRLRQLLFPNLLNLNLMIETVIFVFGSFSCSLILFLTFLMSPINLGYRIPLTHISGEKT